MNTPIHNLFGKHQDPMIPVSYRYVLSTKDVSKNVPLVVALHEENTQLRAENRTLKKALEAYEAEALGSNQTTFEYPPSTDSPYQSNYPKKKRQNGNKTTSVSSLGHLEGSRFRP